MKSEREVEEKMKSHWTQYALGVAAGFIGYAACYSIDLLPEGSYAPYTPLIVGATLGVASLKELRSRPLSVAALTVGGASGAGLAELLSNIPLPM